MSRQWGHGFHTGVRETHELYELLNNQSADEREAILRAIAPSGYRTEEFYFTGSVGKIDATSVVVDLRSGRWKGLTISADAANTHARDAAALAALRSWFCS
jgi:hypothetical protein